MNTRHSRTNEMPVPGQFRVLTAEDEGPLDKDDAQTEYKRLLKSAREALMEATFQLAKVGHVVHSAENGRFGTALLALHDAEEAQAHVSALADALTRIVDLHRRVGRG